MKEAQQSNRKHKSLRDKLKKKRAEKKAHQKEKKLRKKNPELRQPKAKAKRYGIDVRPLRLLFKELVKQYRDELEDFFGVFATLDKGGTIDVSGMQDQTMRKLLCNILQTLKAKRQGSVFSCAHKTQTIVRQVLGKVMEDYVQASESEEFWNQDSDSAAPQVKQQVSNQTPAVCPLPPKGINPLPKPVEMPKQELVPREDERYRVTVQDRLSRTAAAERSRKQWKELVPKGFGLLSRDELADLDDL